jgi:hypothetical protein
LTVFVFELPGGGRVEVVERSGDAYTHAAVDDRIERSIELLRGQLETLGEFADEAGRALRSKMTEPDAAIKLEFGVRLTGGINIGIANGEVEADLRISVEFPS